MYLKQNVDKHREMLKENCFCCFEIVFFSLHCGSVFLWKCIFVEVYFCGSVFLWKCIFVEAYFCGSVFLCKCIFVEVYFLFGGASTVGVYYLHLQTHSISDDNTSLNTNTEVFESKSKRKGKVKVKVNRNANQILEYGGIFCCYTAGFNTQAPPSSNL